MDKMSNILVETFSIGSGSSNLKFPTTSVVWFNNSLESLIDPTKANSSGASVVMIGYRRLNQFLPKRYLQKERWVKNLVLNFDCFARGKLLNFYLFAVMGQKLNTK